MPFRRSPKLSYSPTASGFSAKPNLSVESIAAARILAFRKPATPTTSDGSSQNPVAAPIALDMLCETLAPLSLLSVSCSQLASCVTWKR